MDFLRRHQDKAWIPLTAAALIFLLVFRTVHAFGLAALWIVAVLAALWVARFLKGGGLGGSRYLCDSCKFDYDRACHRPERPNATKCPDYERRGTYV